jgi:hypothetical protein
MNAGKSLIIPQALYERARRVAQRQQRNVTDVVTDVLAQSLPIIEDQLDRPERKREIEAFVQMHPFLWREFPGEYVAIYGGRLIDHDIDRVALLNRINQNYPGVFVLIRPVREDPEIVYEHRSIRWVVDTVGT